MVNRRQTRQASRLQDVLSARQYNSAGRDEPVESNLVPNDTAAPHEGHKKITSPPAVQSSGSSTNKANQDTPSESMPKVRSRLHVRRSAGRPRLDANNGGAVLSEVCLRENLLEVNVSLSRLRIVEIRSDALNGPTDSKRKLLLKRPGSVQQIWKTGLIWLLPQSLTIRLRSRPR